MLLIGETVGGVGLATVAPDTSHGVLVTEGKSVSQTSLCP